MHAKNPIKIIECPRDAMQGYEVHFKTTDKINYINQLLKVGFDVLDCASFVSPKAIPQMADSEEVIKELDLANTNTKLLSIVANARGAEKAASLAPISFLGYPFSISETFQLRNTNKTITESLLVLKEINQIANEGKKELVVYLSMGFGNPYNEAWSKELAAHWVAELAGLGIKIISLSDTVGSAATADISYIFDHLINKYPDIEFGAHLHCKPYEWRQKLEAAYKGGCCRFDGAIRGFGGCPMATDVLTGNMPTEGIISLFKEEINPDFSYVNFDKSLIAADKLFRTIEH